MNHVWIIGHHGRGFLSRKALGRRNTRVTPQKLHDFFYGRGMAKDDAREHVFIALYGYKPERSLMSRRRFHVTVHAKYLPAWEGYKRIVACQDKGPTVPMPSYSCGGGDAFHHPLA